MDDCCSIARKSGYDLAGIGAGGSRRPPCSTPVGGQPLQPGVISVLSVFLSHQPDTADIPTGAYTGAGLGYAVVVEKTYPSAEGRLLEVSVRLQPDVMGSRKVRAEVSHLEVIETGRRRRLSEAEKLRIVAESYAGPRRVASTARRHGISRSLLTTWRRAWRAGLLGGDVAPDFSPVIVAPDPAAVVPARHDGSAEVVGRMEIEFGAGRRIVVGADVDADALARVLAVLGPR